MDRYPLDPNQVQQIMLSLQDILDDPTMYTASGRPVPSPRTSMAMLPNVMLNSMPGGGAASAVGPNLSRNPRFNPSSPSGDYVRVSEVAKELQKAKIDQILSGINLDMPPRLPVENSQSLLSRAMGSFGEAATKVSPLLGILELLTYSPELNTGEQAELEKRRKIPFGK
jgi:hypothetical protein